MYIQANQLNFFKNLNLDDSVKVGIHHDNGFQRIYFHDNIPGNFLCIINTQNGKLSNFDAHWSVNGFDGSESYKSIDKHYLNEIVFRIVDTCKTAGFGVTINESVEA